MTLREVLQIEIWSKRTTRKILLGCGLLVVVGIGFVGWVEVDQTWLTASERRTGKVALEQIDALQRLAAISEVEYSADYRDAEAKIAAAERVARTRRDKGFVSGLEAYLGLTNLEWQEQQDSLRFSTSPNERVRKASVRDPHLVSSSNSSREWFSKTLHQELQ